MPLREAHESVVAAGGPDADNKDEDEAKQGENPTSRVERLGPRVPALLCLATALIWVRSYYARDNVAWVGWRDEAAGVWGGRGVFLSKGVITAYDFRGPWKVDDISHLAGVSDVTMQPHLMYHVDPPRDAQKLFRHDSVSYGPENFRFVGMPLLFVLIAFAILPAWYGIRLIPPGRADVSGNMCY